MSTSSISSAVSSTASGSRSLTGAPVMVATASATDSRCCTLQVLITSMPASRISSMSCQRFSRGEPGTLVCASSSTMATCGWRAITASVSISSMTTPRYSMRRRGICSRPASSSAVCGRPWVSTNPTTTSVPRSSRRCASSSIRKVLPTPGAMPR